MGNPLGMLLLLAIPILLLLHYLQTRRTEVRVASLELWKEALGGREEGAKSRFRPNLDLILLLAVVLLAALAAVLPFLPTDANRNTPLLVVIDCSASMADTDAWNRAIRDVRDKLTASDASVRVSICEAGPLPRLICRQAKPDKALEALNTIRIYDTECDIDEAVSLVRSIEPMSRPWVLTDRTPNLSGEADVDAYGKREGNVGFVAAELTPSGLFCAVANYSTDTWNGSILYNCENIEKPVLELALKPMERRDLLLDVENLTAKGVFLSLSPPTGLASDDRLFVSGDTLSVLHVAVAGDLATTEKERGILGALESIDGLNVKRIEGSDFPNDVKADVFIGVCTSIPSFDMPGLYFLPASGQGFTKTDKAWSGDVEITEPPHRYFLGSQGSKLNFYKNRIQTGAVYDFDPSIWKPVLKSADSVALACRGNIWIAAFSPEPVADSWIRDPAFALFIAQLMETATEGSSRRIMNRTSINYPRVGFHDGIAINMLSDSESNLLDRSSNERKGPNPGIPVTDNGKMDFAYIMMCLALLTYLARMFVSSKIL